MTRPVAAIATVAAARAAKAARREYRPQVAAIQNRSLSAVMAGSYPS
jgi:hypothetical protein